MKRKYVEPLITLGIGLGMVVVASLVINGIHNISLVENLAQAWLDKGGECMEEPHTYVTQHDKQFHFECPIKEETPEQKAYRQLPSNVFDIERTQDTTYLLQYLKDNPPTYDCALLDKYAKPNVPCWQEWGIGYRTLLFNSDAWLDRNQ
jgi:hypothetical protein